MSVYLSFQIHSPGKYTAAYPSIQDHFEGLNVADLTTATGSDGIIEACGSRLVFVLGTLCQFAVLEV